MSYNGIKQSKKVWLCGGGNMQCLFTINIPVYWRQLHVGNGSARPRKQTKGYVATFLRKSANFVPMYTH